MNQLPGLDGSAFSRDHNSTSKLSAAMTRLSKLRQAMADYRSAHVQALGVAANTDQVFASNASITVADLTIGQIDAVIADLQSHRSE